MYNLPWLLREKEYLDIHISSLYRKRSQTVILILNSSNSSEEIFALAKCGICSVEHCYLIMQVICMANNPHKIISFNLFSRITRLLL